MRCGNCEEEPLICEKCGKQIKGKEAVCFDTTGGADDPEHYHPKCFKITPEEYTYKTKNNEVNE